MQSNRLSFWRPSRLPYIAVSDLVPPPVVVMATTGTCSTQQGRRSKSHAYIRHKQPLLRKSDNRLQALIQAGMLLGMKRMWLLQKACLPLPDWYERESLCLTRSDGVGSCLLNIWKSTSPPCNFSQSVLLEAVIENTGFTTREQIMDAWFCL